MVTKYITTPSPIREGNYFHHYLLNALPEIDGRNDEILFKYQCSRVATGYNFMNYIFRKEEMLKEYVGYGRHRCGENITFLSEIPNVLNNKIT